LPQLFGQVRRVGAEDAGEGAQNGSRHGFRRRFRK
jgi:hypothetical protein